MDGGGGGDGGKREERRGQVAPESKCLCRMDLVKHWPGAPYNQPPPRKHTPLLLALALFEKLTHTQTHTSHPPPLRTLPQAGRPALFMSAVGGRKNAPQETGCRAGRAGPL